MGNKTPVGGCRECEAAAGPLSASEEAPVARYHDVRLPFTVGEHGLLRVRFSGAMQETLISWDGDDLGLIEEVSVAQGRFAPFRVIWSYRMISATAPGALCRVEVASAAEPGDDEWDGRLRLHRGIAVVVRRVSMEAAAGYV